MAFFERNQMVYTTLTKIREKMDSETIRQLTDDHDTGSIDEGVVDALILSETNYINSILRGRYPIKDSIDDVPEFIIDMCTKLVRYALYERRTLVVMPDSIVTGHKNATKMIEKIQARKITPFEESDEPEVIKYNKTPTDKVYTSTVWTGY